jgi:hypothetical protein
MISLIDGGQPQATLLKRSESMDSSLRSGSVVCYSVSWLDAEPGGIKSRIMTVPTGVPPISV